jgi:hypothetical protein
VTSRLHPGELILAPAGAVRPGKLGAMDGGIYVDRNSSGERSEDDGTRNARLVDQARGQLQAVALAGLSPGPQLHRYRQPTPSRAARAIATARSGAAYPSDRTAHARPSDPATTEVSRPP